MRIPRHLYYIRMAQMVAERSTCSRAKVGAVLTNHNRVIGTGYNGGPTGCEHCIDGDCLKNEDGRCIRTIHAEINAILSREGQPSVNDEMIMYCTHSPCFNCYKIMAQYGVKKIIYSKYYEDKYTQILMREIGIPILHIDEV